MKYFGTDGIRGIFGKKLTLELAFKAGLAAAKTCGEWFVGLDTRESGNDVYLALRDGLISGGSKVFKVGIVPTPCISFLAARHGKCGIMITASHNPPEYNGLKFFFSSGYKFDSHAEEKIEHYLLNPPLFGSGGSEVDYKTGRDEYIEFLVKAGGNLGGKEIALDCAFGSAVTVAKEVFDRCGAQVKTYSDGISGSKINCGVGALYPSFVKSKTSGLGFAFDGDADRVAVTCGDVIDGDSVLYNLSTLLKPRGVVGTVMNNVALERLLLAKKIPFKRTAVGDKHISDAMRRLSFTLGGEQSGHYIISPSKTGDGIFTALMLSKLDNFTRLELVPQQTVSVDACIGVEQNARFILAKTECQKMLLGKGRLVVRMSGTESKIRIMVESEREDLIASIIKNLTNAINLCNKELL